jgi:hypothetical protein
VTCSGETAAVARAAAERWARLDPTRPTFAEQLGPPHGPAHPDLASLPLRERVRTLLAHHPSPCGLTAAEVARELGVTVPQATRALVVLRRRTYGRLVRESRWRLREENER